MVSIADPDSLLNLEVYEGIFFVETYNVWIQEFNTRYNGGDNLCLGSY